MLSFLFKTIYYSKFYCPYILGYVVIHSSVVDLIRGHTLKEKCLLPSSYQLPIAPCHPLGFWCFLRADTTTVGSYMWLPCCVQKTLFSCSHPPPHDFYNLSTLSSAMTSGLWGMDIKYMSYLRLTVSSLHIDQLWFYVFIFIYCKVKLIQWGVRDALRYGHNDVIRSLFDTMSSQQNNSNRFFTRAYGLSCHRFLTLIIMSVMSPILYDP